MFSRSRVYICHIRTRTSFEARTVKQRLLLQSGCQAGLPCVGGWHSDKECSWCPGVHVALHPFQHSIKYHLIGFLRFHFYDILAFIFEGVPPETRRCFLRQYISSNWKVHDQFFQWLGNFRFETHGERTQRGSRGRRLQNLHLLSSHPP